MGEVTDEDLRAVEQALVKSRRYTTVSPITVRRLAGKALLAARGDRAEAVKRTKRGLHEIHGAYLPGSAPQYDGMLRRITAAVESGDDAAVEEALANAMRVHASTRERLPYLADFHAGIRALAPEFRTVRDVACGLNPLGARHLPDSVTYLASDIDARQVGFLGSVLTLLGVDHRAEVVDLVDNPLAEPADLTLLLKTVPCLERQRAGAGWDLLDSVNSPTVVVTFPTRSLGQRSKGMYQTHSAAMTVHAAERPWSVEEFELPNELVYVIRK